MVVAGGGGGGNGTGAGYETGAGGAGGLIHDFSYPVGPGNHTVTVGAAVGSATNGNNSVFSGLTAIGGGKGGQGANTPGGDGGSGGGASQSPLGTLGGSGTAGQGHDGGKGYASRGGGGGGASEPGYGIGSGGDGLQYDLLGTLSYYAGGGCAKIDWKGGLGGGGDGGAGIDGGANTGGGGCGVASNGAGGGDGGSGIVIVRYPIRAYPRISFYADEIIPTTATTTLNWSVQNATSCTASDAWSGSKDLSGSEVVGPFFDTDKTYTLSCTGAGGTTINRVVINQNDPYYDSDGNGYGTVDIGTQTWLATNLKNKGPNDCSDVTWVNSSDTGWCGDYDGGPHTDEGYMYQWSAVMDGSTTEGAQGLCPDGTHIPSDGEWYTLENYLDSSINSPSATGNRGSTIRTAIENGGSSGFDLFFAGKRQEGGGWWGRLSQAFYWTSTQNGSNAWRRTLYNTQGYSVRAANTKLEGMAVRCIVD